MATELELFTAKIEYDMNDERALSALDKLESRVKLFTSDLGGFKTNVQDFGTALELALEAPQLKMGAFQSLARVAMEEVRQGGLSAASGIQVVSFAAGEIASRIPILKNFAGAFETVSRVAKMTNSVVERLRMAFGGQANDMDRIIRSTSDLAESLKLQAGGWKSLQSAQITAMREGVSSIEKNIAVTQRLVIAQEARIGTMINEGATEQEVANQRQSLIATENRLADLQVSHAAAVDELNIAYRVQGPIIQQIRSYASTAATAVRHMMTGFLANGKVAPQRLEDVTRSLRLMNQEMQRLKKTGGQVPEELSRTYAQLNNHLKTVTAASKRQAKEQESTGNIVRRAATRIVEVFRSEKETIDKTSEAYREHQREIRNTQQANQRLAQYVAPGGVVPTGIRNIGEESTKSSQNIHSFSMSLGTIVGLAGAVGGALGQLDPAFSAMIVGAGQVFDQVQRGFVAMAAVAGDKAAQIKAAINIMSNSLMAFGIMALGVVVKTGMLGAEVTTLEITLRQVAANIANEAGGDVQRFQEYVMNLRDAIVNTGITTREATAALIQFTRAKLPLDKIEQLAQDAKNLGVTVADMSSSEVFGRFIEIINTGNSALFKQIGITKTAVQMQEDYAASVGKSKDALTSAELQLAIIEGIHKQTETVAGVYDKAQETAGKQLSSLKRLFEEFMLSIGSRFEPLIASAVKALNEFFKWFSRLSPATVDGIASVIKVVAIFGTLLGAIMAIGPAIAGLGPIFIAFGGTVMAAMPWLLAISAAIGALVLAVKVFKGAWDANFGGIQSTVKAFVDTIKTSLAPIIEDIRYWAAIIGKHIRDIVNLLTGLLMPSFTSVSEAIFRFKETIRLVFYDIQDIINGSMLAIAKILTGFKYILGGNVELGMNYMKDAVIDGMTVIALVFKNIIGKAMTWGWNLIVQFSNGIVKATTSVVAKVMKWFGTAIGKFIEPGSPPKEGPLSHIIEWGKGIMDTFLTAFKTADFGILRDAVGLVRSALQGAVEAGNMAEQDMIPTLQKVRKQIANLLTDYRKTGVVNEEVIRQISDALGKGGEDYVEYLRRTMDYQKALDSLTKTQEEYDEKAAGGFVPRELQERLDAAKEQVDATKDAVEWQKEYIAALQDGADLQQQQLDILKKLAEAIDKLAGGKGGDAEPEESPYELPDLSGMGGIENPFDGMRESIGGVSQEFIDMRAKVEEFIQKVKDFIALPWAEKWAEIKKWGGDALKSFFKWFQDLTGIDLEAELSKLNTWVTEKGQEVLDWLEDLTGWDIGKWAEKLGTKIGEAWDWIVEKAQWLYDALVGKSIIPEMIDEVIEEFDRLDNINPFTYYKRSAEWLVKQLNSIFRTIEFKLEEWFPSIDFSKLFPTVGTGILDFIGTLEEKFAKLQAFLLPLTELVAGPLDALKEILDALTASVVEQWPTIQQALDDLGAAFADAYEEFKPLIDPLLEFLGKIALWVGAGALSAFLLIVNAIFSTLTGVLSGLAEAIPGIIQMFTGVVQIVSGVARFIVGFFNLITAAIKLFKGDTEGAMNAAALAYETFKGAIGAVWEGIKTIFSGAFSAIMLGVGTFVLSFLRSFTSFIVGVLEKFGLMKEGTVEKVRAMFDDGIELLKTFVEDFKTWWGDVWAWVIEVVTETWTALVGQSIIPDMFADIITSVTGFITDFTDFWTGLWEDALSSVSTFVTDMGTKVEEIITTVTGVATDLYTAGASFLTELWGGFSSGWEEFIGKIKGKWQEFKDSLPFSEPKDPTSPLRGLGKAGESILKNVMAGMENVDVSSAFNAQLSGIVAQMDQAVASQISNQYFVAQGAFAGAFPGVKTERDAVGIGRQLQGFFDQASIRSTSRGG